MNRQFVRMVIGLLVAASLSLSITFIAAAQEKKTMAPSIVGTWKLVSRKLPDGTTLTPPSVQGLQTFTRTMRNFNVEWADKSGKHFSYSVISNYKLTDSEYSETLQYSCMNDEIGIMKDKPAGGGPTYVTSSETKTAPVTLDGTKIKFHLPFDPPEVVFDGNTMTGTLEGGFVDTWERMR
jgi:hypothetical protein